MEMKKDNRTEFEKMEAGEMFWNSDEKIGELKKHARRLAHRFNATTEDEPELRLSILKELFGDCDDDIFIKPPFHCDYGFHIHVGKNFFANFQCVMLDVVHRPVCIPSTTRWIPRPELPTMSMENRSPSVTMCGLAETVSFFRVSPSVITWL